MKRDAADNIKKETVRHFDTQAANYNTEADGKFSAATYKEILTRLEGTDGRCILDIGCGNGNILAALSRTDGSRKLAGLDLSPKMIEEAQKKLGNLAELKVGDAEELPFESKSMDVIICNMSFHHYPNPKRVLFEMHRVLKEDGILLIGEPDPPFLMRKFVNATSRLTRSGDYKMYSRKEFESLLKECGWRMERWGKPNALSCVFEGRKQQSL